MFSNPANPQNATSTPWAIAPTPEKVGLIAE